MNCEMDKLFNNDEQIRSEDKEETIITMEQYTKNDVSFVDHRP